MCAGEGEREGRDDEGGGREGRMKERGEGGGREGRMREGGRGEDEGEREGRERLKHGAREGG